MNERSMNTTSKPRIIVVGGGYVGWEVARDMDAHADVTLIEQREAFVHVSAMIRAVVQPSLLDQAISEMDLTKRTALMRQVQQRMAEALPYFPLWYWNTALIMRKGLTGLEPGQLSLSGALGPLARLRE